MYFSVAITAGLALVGAAVASPKKAPFCMTDVQAKTVAGYFSMLLSNYTTPFAKEVIANDYTDYASSVNTLIDSGSLAPIPLGAPTFASKADFIKGQGSQPPIPFHILQTWHTCDAVTIRWVSKQKPQPVYGIDVLVVEPSSNPKLPYQIKTTYGEFNSGAWLANLGRPECHPAINATHH